MSHILIQKALRKNSKEICLIVRRPKGHRFIVPDKLLVIVGKELVNATIMLYFIVQTTTLNANQKDRLSRETLRVSLHHRKGNSSKIKVGIGEYVSQLISSSFARPRDAGE